MPVRMTRRAWRCMTLSERFSDGKGRATSSLSPNIIIRSGCVFRSSQRRIRWAKENYGPEPFTVPAAGHEIDSSVGADPAARHGGGLRPIVGVNPIPALTPFLSPTAPRELTSNRNVTNGKTSRDSYCDSGFTFAWSASPGGTATRARVGVPITVWIQIQVDGYKLAGDSQSEYDHSGTVRCLLHSK